MKRSGKSDWEDRLNRKLAKSGFRFTNQRQQVYSVLLQTRDHPTAEQVFMRAKKAMPDISMATVYNCLDALVSCELVNEVNLDRTATRYCPNMEHHHHFYCDSCFGVFDIVSENQSTPVRVRVPVGYKVARVDVAIHGACPKCNANETADIDANTSDDAVTAASRRSGSPL